MRETIEKYLFKLLRKADPAYHSSKTSWSQQGEDLILDFIFTWKLNCPLPSYLDIGANHPSILSNTFYFYKKGCRGVNIEPDPDLIRALNKKRPGDINLNIGIGSENKELDYYRMSSSTLNTFSKAVAEEYLSTKQFGQQQIVSVEKVMVMPVNDILEKYFTGKSNYFISIDVEGLDFEIVQSLDFEKYKPPVICIETNGSIGTGVIERQNKTIDFILEKGYEIYADNAINSIFVKKGLFKI